MNTKYLVFILFLSLLVFVLELVRREKLTFKYAFGWILLSLAGMILTIFHSLLYSFSYLLGFELPSNFIFFSGVVAGIFVTLFLTIFLCQQNSRNDRIAQKLGLLEQAIERLSEEVSKK